MSYAVGSLVRARGREWVVLPESAGDLLVLRPLGGAEEEVAGILTTLEPVTPARFAPPDPEQPGDFRSARLLRDAARLGFRSSAGPFRSFGRIAVEPRPYQLVPLLVALRQDPVRLLIADDVGIGKTVEAALIARELLDRGEVRRTAVLCPPHLAEQWQTELREKFHIEAELVLPSTAARLERGCRIGQSLFEVYDHVIVSLDFIKSERRRGEFLRTCPEFVIVDEAHTCATGQGRGARHQRHELVKGLAADPARHLLLVTATPHSGDEGAFRSLLGLLDPAFATLPDDLSGEARRTERQRLARHFVQRRRADIRHYLRESTVFPEREDLKPEPSYRLTPEYRAFFEKVLRYARETVADTEGGRLRQRVRWWSALALLRSIASSPAAAAATLRARAAAADAATPEEADEAGRRSVFDQVDDDAPEGADLTPGSDAGEEGPSRRRLLDMAREAEALTGAKDAKLGEALKLVAGLVQQGYQPIVFCRFITTAQYVAEALRAGLPRDVAVQAVTGLLPPAEREERVASLAGAARRVLVATDCLSEGINLQHGFDAVVHYDLSWNPTRHEQREGRVDRYGQARERVRVVTYYGADNQIDGIVLDVLLRKHQTIRSSLGVSVPVPVDNDEVVEAIFEGLLLRGSGGAQAALPGLEDYVRPRRERLYAAWESAAEKERRSRTLFAQESIHPDAVAAELGAMRAAIGAEVEIERFLTDALRLHGGHVQVRAGLLAANLRECPPALRAVAGGDDLRGRVALPVKAGERYLNRTDPVVEGIAAWVLDTALDTAGEGHARRSGVLRTAAVERRTTLLLVRFRHHITVRRSEAVQQLLAEECQTLAFTGPPREAQWLTAEAAEALLAAAPSGNVTADVAAERLRAVLAEVTALDEPLAEHARRRAAALLESHRRVRDAARQRGVSYEVEPQLPADILGLYVLLPSPV